MNGANYNGFFLISCTLSLAGRTKVPKLSSYPYKRRMSSELFYTVYFFKLLLIPETIECLIDNNIWSLNCSIKEHQIWVTHLKSIQLSGIAVYYIDGRLLVRSSWLMLFPITGCTFGFSDFWKYTHLLLQTKWVFSIKC